MEIVFSEQPSSHNVHTHVHYEMLYILEGAVSVSILGREYPAKAGDLIFLNQFEEHATRLLSPVYRRYYVLLPPGEMQSLPHDVGLLSVFRLHGGNFPYVLPAEESKARFDFYFSLLHEAARGASPCQDARLEALITLILTEAQALRPDFFTFSEEQPLLPLQELLRQLDQNFTEDFSLASLARQYHVSPGCLSAHFRKSVGLSPMQYVTQSRLTLAKRLLMTTGLPIRDIAAQCGYHDLSNFSRRFHQQFQCTPQRFRQACRE